MREIKFRAQRVGNKEWVYGFYGARPDGAVFICPFENYESYAVIPESVGQYTGLKDKNGNDIYEGDIIQIGAIIKEVKWIEGGNYAGWNIGNGKRYSNSKGHQIIGNVFKNINN